MKIKNLEKKDLEAFKDLLKEFFPVHNIFQKPDNEILTYLKEQLKQNPGLIALEADKVVGGLFLIKKQENIDSSHKVWKFRHFTFKDDNIAKELLSAAEDYVKKQSKTAKIELTIAENEKGIDFYKANGYTEEGKLENHYRFGETTLILGKSLTNE